MMMRDMSFPPADAQYRFDHRLRFTRTLAQAEADVKAVWSREYRKFVEFDVREVRPLAFGQFIFFARGRYDNWAVWVGRVEADGETYVALVEDKYYFEILRRLANAYGGQRVFADVVALYYAMAWHKTVHDEVLELIRKLSSRYPGYENRCWMYNALMHIYYGMLAEENKNFAPMGRRTKVHGVGRLLMCGDSVDAAACCSEGRPWRVVDAEVQSWGLVPDDVGQRLSEFERASILRHRSVV